MTFPEPTLHHRQPGDFLLRRDGDGLVGIVASTEHLTVGTMSLPGGKKTAVDSHGGDECLYVTEGVLNVHVPDSAQWLELAPGDGFYCPEGVARQYRNLGRKPVEAVFGIAPRWHSELA